MTCSDHTTLDGGALRHAPLRLLDLESLCSGRSDQSDWLYQVRPSKLWNRFDPPNTLDLLSLTTWNGVNIFQKNLVKQLRHWVFFGAIWLLHLGTQRKLHTKYWFFLSLSMQLLFDIPIMKLRQKRWRKCRR